MPIKAITVFCGAELGKDPRFEDEAKALGKCMAEKNIELIYGGGNVGLMGALAQTVHDNGGQVTGFLPEFFVTKNPALLEFIGSTVVVQDMHTRKKSMLEKADAFIALPGGFGTAEELLEMITWRQLGLHNKPIGIINTAGYYRGFLEWINHAVDEGFIQSTERYPMTMDIVVVADSCEELLHKLTENAEKS